MQAAGKGTKYLPAYHAVTPDDVWSHYGLTPEAARAAGMNSQMFNSFLDGTKSAIEMAAIANGCGLDVPPEGLGFPPCGVDDLAHVLRPRDEGGQLAGRGMVEVISSLERDGRPVFRDLRWGVYVVLEAPNDYAAACFSQYGLPVDSTGRYGRDVQAVPPDRPGTRHLRPVGRAAWRADRTVPRVPRRCGRGCQARPQDRRPSRRRGRLHGLGQGDACGRLGDGRALPIGLAHGVTLVRDVARGTVLTYADVEALPVSEAITLRRETEAMVG